MGTCVVPLMQEAIAAVVGDLKMGGLTKHVLVPTLQLNGELGWTPDIVSNLPAPDGVYNDHYDELVLNVAMATSAAPTFFPTFNAYGDGGVYANNPAQVAIAKVKRCCE